MWIGCGQGGEGGGGYTDRDLISWAKDKSCGIQSPDGDPPLEKEHCHSEHIHKMLKL